MLAQPDVTLRDRLSILPTLAALHAMRCHAEQTRSLAAELRKSRSDSVAGKGSPRRRLATGSAQRSR
jgi:hypothetical protein